MCSDVVLSDHHLIKYYHLYSNTDMSLSVLISVVSDSVSIGKYVTKTSISY